MYKKARTQRRFNPNHVDTPKVDRGQYLQTVYKDGVHKLIVHDKPTKSQVSVFKFMVKHGIKSGMVIANGFKKPTGASLKAERILVKNKKSKLSYKQRESISI